MNPGSLSRRSAHRLRDRFREETAQAVLTAAEQVFAEQGLHGASMSQIAERAGVAVGTLYNHFKDKEALLDALMVQRNRELLERMDQSLAKLAKEPFRAQLEGFVGAMLEHFEEHRNFIMILLQGEHDHERIKNEKIRAIYQRVDQLIRTGYQKKALRPELEPLCPSFLMGIVRAMLMREKYGAAPTDLRAQVAKVADFFLRGAGR
jgi:AcrR family transcriptional regulator